MYLEQGPLMLRLGLYRASEGPLCPSPYEFLLSSYSEQVAGSLSFKGELLTSSRSCGPLTLKATFQFLSPGPAVLCIQYSPFFSLSESE